MTGAAPWIAVCGSGAAEAADDLGHEGVVVAASAEEAVRGARVGDLADADGEDEDRGERVGDQVVAGDVRHGPPKLRRPV